MARQSRSRRVRRERARRERERRIRQALVDEMNEFLEADTDIESFEEFETVSSTPFDDFNAESVNQRDFQSEQEAYEDMQGRYNYTSDDRRRRTFRQRTHSVDDEHYSQVVQTLGTDIYKKLKEQFGFDSDQVIDVIMGFSSDITSRDIEAAMLQLTYDLGMHGDRAYMLNQEDIEEAIRLGFSYDEAVYLAGQDSVIVNHQNFDSVLNDYIRTILAEQNIHNRNRQNTRDRYAEAHRGQF